MPRSDEIDISRDPGTGVDIGIGAGGMDGGFIEAVAQELDNAANNVGAGHPDWGMSGSAEPMSAEQAVANINAAKIIIMPSNIFSAFPLKPPMNI